MGTEGAKAGEFYLLIPGESFFTHVRSPKETNEIPAKLKAGIRTSPPGTFRIAEKKGQHSSESLAAVGRESKEVRLSSTR